MIERFVDLCYQYITINPMIWIWFFYLWYRYILIELIRRVTHKLCSSINCTGSTCHFGGSSATKNGQYKSWQFEIEERLICAKKNWERLQYFWCITFISFSLFMLMIECNLIGFPQSKSGKRLDNSQNFERNIQKMQNCALNYLFSKFKLVKSPGN